MPSFRDYEPALQFVKIDPLSEIRNAGIVTNGSVFWSKQVDDPDYTTFQDQVGAANVRNSLQASIDQVRSDTNDYVLVVPHTGGTALALGTAVDINEDRVHILGIGHTPAPTSYNGLTYRGYVAADGIDTELVAVTGAGVELGGLKFLGTSGTADGGTIARHLLIGTSSAGTAHDFYMHDVHIENTQAAADNGTAFIVQVAGDVGGGIQGITIERCWLGNFSWAPASVIQSGGTAGPTRLTVRDTTFVIDAQATTDDFVVLGTGVTEYQTFKNCDFINVEAGTAPASVFTGAVLVDNPVLVRDSSGVNVTAIGTDTELLITPNLNGTAAGVRNPNIGFIGTAQVVIA